jgi:hypothetical protein
MKTKYFIHCFTLLLVIACSQTPPVIPEAKNVEVSRKPAKKSCEEIGPVEGRAVGPKGGFEEALADLKKDAAHRGANYVHLGQSGAMATAVRGVAYICR